MKFKYSLSLLLSLPCVCAAFSQNIGFDDKKYVYESYSEQYKIIDTARYEVKYAHVSKDPILNKSERRYEILLFGETHNLYKSFGAYLFDSVINSRAGELYSFNEYRNMSRDLDVKHTHQITDLYKSELMHVEGIFGDRYFYYEPFPKFDWQLEEGEEEIMGHLCHKATTRWRGRDWTAWYSDIPFPYGPWKFNGLPGLILKIEDTTGEQKFKAVESFNREVPIGYDKYEGFRTTRERFNKMLKNHKENAGEMMLKSGMVKMDEKEAARIRKRRLFYAPIELE